MEPKQMLEAVIEKAIKNGYPDGYWPKDARLFLFDHNFAKAIWQGKGHRHLSNVDSRDCPWDCETDPWEKHIQAAVLSEDPLLYYYQHL